MGTIIIIKKKIIFSLIFLFINKNKKLYEINKEYNANLDPDKIIDVLIKINKSKKIYFKYLFLDNKL